MCSSVVDHILSITKVRILSFLSGKNKGTHKIIEPVHEISNNLTF